MLQARCVQLEEPLGAKHFFGVASGVTIFKQKMNTFCLVSSKNKRKYWMFVFKRIVLSVREIYLFSNLVSKRLYTLLWKRKV